MGRVGASLWGKGSLINLLRCVALGESKGCNKPAAAPWPNWGPPNFTPHLSLPGTPSRELAVWHDGLALVVCWCWWWRRRAVPSSLGGMTRRELGKRTNPHVVLKGAPIGVCPLRGPWPCSSIAGSATSLRHGQSCHRGDVGPSCWMLHAMNPLHLFHVDTFLPKPGRDVSGRKKCLLEALSTAHPISAI